MNLRDLSRNLEYSDCNTQALRVKIRIAHMKYFGLITLLAACSFFPQQSMERKREIAQIKVSNEYFDVALTKDSIFPNGNNHTFIKVKFLIDEKIDPKEIEVISDGEIITSKFTLTQGVYVASIRPIAGSEDLNLYIQYKNYKSKHLTLSTYNSPVKDKLENLDFSPSMNTSFNDINFSQRDDTPEGQFDEFGFYNYGPSKMAPNQETNRSYNFSQQEEATQNMTFDVVDAPNSTTSHTMLSHFMLFPRNYLYNIHKTSSGFQVSLPTGEKIIFSKDYEITGGVFSEGPIDVSGDRFKRHYADLKYSGKGILLRANARGQMPQQGQFESTKIDMEYGIKYSADVLIINGTTGQRCRRPKSDFWTSADVSVITFKFPTDKEFNQYLKAKCGFEIPVLEISEEAPEDVTEIINDIWSRCQNSKAPKECINEEAKLITSSKTRAKVKFELNLKVDQLIKTEERSLSSIAENEAVRIQKKLESDLSWATSKEYLNTCLELAKKEINLNLRFHDQYSVMNSAIGLVCQKVGQKVEEKIKNETNEIYGQTKSNLEWLNLASKTSTQEQCFLQAKSLTKSELVDLYSDKLKEHCEQFEKSVEYNEWLRSNTENLNTLLKSQALEKLTKSAQARAQKCLNDFPNDNAINRLRFKNQRQDCLIDHWPVLEQFIIDELSNDPLVKKVNFSLDEVRVYLSEQKRTLQLKIQKQYFN